MLGELLELMHTCADRWSTLQATVRQTRDLQAQRAADAAAGPAFRRSEPPGAPAYLRPDAGPESVTVTATSAGSVRLERPAPSDVPLTVVHPDGAALHLSGDGTARREVVGQRPAIGRWSLGRIRTLLEPHDIGGRYRLRVTGTATVLGRECLVADAVRRAADDARMGLDPLGIFQDGGEVVVDRATGLVLRLTTRFKERVVETHELTRLVLDEPLDPDAFSLEPPPGVQAEIDDHGMKTPAELAALVPFALFAPAPGWDSAPWSGHLRSGTRLPPSVMLHQMSTDRRPPLIMIQAADAEHLPDPAEWQAVDVGGHPGHLWQGDDGVEVLVHRDGTGIWLRHAPDADRALDVLSTLQRVATPTPSGS